MRAEDLDHKELLELDPEGGLIRFAGQRALLIDAVAMGRLRKYLVENFGLTAARMAEAMHDEFKWDSDEDWRRASLRIYTLEGLFRVESDSQDPLSRTGSPRTAGSARKRNWAAARTSLYSRVSSVNTRGRSSLYWPERLAAARYSARIVLASEAASGHRRRRSSACPTRA
jgi:Activator of aromatic catabolism